MERGALMAWRAACLWRTGFGQFGAIQALSATSQSIGSLLSSPHTSIKPAQCTPQHNSLRCSLLRGFASTTFSPPASVPAAQDVLQQVNIVKLRQELEMEGERSLSIPYSRFVEIAVACGASTDAEAAEQCAVLHRAGIIMRHQNIVYLRAEEVADMIMLMLPGGREDAQLKLTKVESELAELDNVHEKLERSSHRRADAVLFTGLIVLITQFVAFIWLTWWELSWDVMEPIAYILSLFYSIVAYMYFMFTRHAFDLGPIQKFWSDRFKEKGVAAAQFDAERYQFLKKLQNRYKRHLRVR